MIRKGLRNVINWNELNCEIAGEAGDGKTGYSLIEKIKPDIVISDIRMPEMDGLEMVKMVKNLNINSKIIILTGYRDFDYVHEAIKLGAFDFLLKPTKINELVSVIKRAVTELKLETDKINEYEKYKRLFEDNIPALREKYLSDLMNGIELDLDSISEKKKLYKIEFNSFVLVLAEINQVSKESTSDKCLHRYGIINTFEDLFSDTYNVLNICINYDTVGFIIVLDQQNDTAIKDISTKCSDLKDIVNKCFGFELTVAISTKAICLTELPNKYKQCKDAIEKKIYLGENLIISYQDIDNFIKFDEHENIENLQIRLLKDIKVGNRLKVENDLEEINKAIQDISTTDISYIKNFYFNTISSINNIRYTLNIKEELDTPEPDTSTLYNLIQSCNNINDLMDILNQGALDITLKVNTFNSNSIKTSLKKALEYLRQNYNQPVTLNEVAEKVYLSTYYLSRIFKKELGMSFVDYLNDLRIKKAMELLKNTDYKTYEIAELVGINDPHYFSRLFKKYSNKTPTEYREEN